MKVRKNHSMNWREVLAIETKSLRALRMVSKEMIGL